MVKCLHDPRTMDEVRNHVFSLIKEWIMNRHMQSRRYIV